MIVLEGPDGGGKTTLMKRICQRFGLPPAPRASDSLKGPTDDLCGWIDNDVLLWGSKDLQVYDRHPLISEPIYGPLCRGRVPDRMTTPWMRHRLKTFRSMSLVIWCIPPINTVLNNIDDSSDNQMDGVVDMAPAIWSAYAVASHSWTAPGMTYDYSSTNIGPQDTQLVTVIRRHLNEWRKW